MLNLVFSIVVIVFCTNGGNACPILCACAKSSVDCSNRHLTKIPANIPSIALQLYLQGNNISHIDFSSSNLSVLGALHLSYNKLMTIQDDSLSNLYLSALFLDHNKLNLEQNVHANTFGKDAHHRLQVLSLSHNNISGILDYQYFSDLNSLVYLDLSYNSLSYIRGDVFPSSINQLDLSFNRIAGIHRQAFGFLHKLTRLDLRGLSMKFFPRRRFSDLQSLVELKLGGKFMQEVSSQMLRGLKSLNFLEISQSNLNSTLLPANLLEFCPKLQHLDMSYNKLTTFPTRFFSRVPNLAWLKLDGNSFNNLDALSSMFQVQNLQWLSLKSNHLSSTLIPFIDEHAKFRFLDLSYNNLEHIYHSFQTSSLTDISFAFNNISAINENAFVNSTSIQSINLTGNLLSSFPLVNGERKLVVYINDNKWNCDCDLYKAFTEILSDTYNGSTNLNCSFEHGLRCVKCNSPLIYKASFFEDLIEQNVFSECKMISSTNRSDTSSQSLVLYIVVPIMVLVVIAILIVFVLWMKRRKFSKHVNAPGNDSSDGRVHAEYQNRAYASINLYMNEREPVAIPSSDICSRSKLGVENIYATVNEDATYSMASEPENLNAGNGHLPISTNIFSATHEDSDYLAPISFKKGNDTLTHLDSEMAAEFSVNGTKDNTKTYLDGQISGYVSMKQQ